jgi:hypothetical protein
MSYQIMMGSIWCIPSTLELLPMIRAMTKPYTSVVLVARGHTTLQRVRNGETVEGIELLADACIGASTGNCKVADEQT